MWSTGCRAPQSTRASAVEERLIAAVGQSASADGDNLRHASTAPSLRRARAARERQAPAHVARLLAESGPIALSASSSPTSTDRDAGSARTRATSSICSSRSSSTALDCASNATQGPLRAGPRRRLIGLTVSARRRSAGRTGPRARHARRTVERGVIACRLLKDRGLTSGLREYRPRSVAPDRCPCSTAPPTPLCRSVAARGARGVSSLEARRRHAPRRLAPGPSFAGRMPLRAPPVLSAVRARAVSIEGAYTPSIAAAGTPASDGVAVRAPPPANGSEAVLCLRHGGPCRPAENAFRRAALRVAPFIGPMRSSSRRRGPVRLENGLRSQPVSTPLSRDPAPCGTRFARSAAPPEQFPGLEPPGSADDASPTGRR